MEIYEIFNGIVFFMGQLETILAGLAAEGVTIKPIFPNETAFLWASLGASFFIWIALFLLQSFALYRMAKNQGIGKRFLAFIPFANILYMSKLAGKCTFFGRRMKNAGIYAMIAQIVCTLFCAATVAAQMYVHLNCGGRIVVEDVEQAIGGMTTKLHWLGEKDFSYIVFKFYTEYSQYIVAMISFAYKVFMFIVISALIRKYAPKGQFILSLVAFLEPISRYIILFVLKNRKAIDYEAYMRQKRADYFTYQQQRYSSYGNPYSNPQNNGQAWQNGQNAQPNPNGQSAQNGQNTQNENSGDPFEEFSSNSGSQSDDNNSSDKKDFFS